VTVTVTGTRHSTYYELVVYMLNTS
jgi:hypothetical protein